MRKQALMLAALLMVSSLSGCSLNLPFQKDSIKELLPSAVQDLLDKKDEAEEELEELEEEVAEEAQEEESAEETEEAEKGENSDDDSDEETKEQEQIEDITPAVEEPEEATTQKKETTVQETEPPQDTASDNSQWKSMVADAYGEPEYYECHDYDNDGQEEAFAVVATNGTNESHSIIYVLYISSDGEIQDITSDVLDDGGYLEVTYADVYSVNRGFLAIWTSAGGSGNYCDILSVRDGSYYHLDLTDDNLFKFYAEDGIAYGSIREGFYWPIYRMEYDVTTGQFSFGEKVAEDIG